MNLIWTCAVCGRQTNGYGVLGVAAHAARAGSFQHWKTVHHPCFERAGLSYGIDLRDIETAGWQWWARHIGEKSWAEHTDFHYALGEVG